ncbi:major facilitator superfamily domain-containing protein [Fusarium redolens]|uniref:Major facilitator superfamily domain-containing protein n=1 Tax=Fusarium redolens TaxID=48865 RepID=A0A9P9FY79_FUSRE|nr:major facilitator superfamily domain-containing protein [Fusarium redolens]KAH7207808.1 major facilitator superfamily domain-containing protein [Fusarium redolens]
MSSDDKHSHHESLAFDQENSSQIVVDAAAERSYLRKMDAWLLSYLSVMYFFNAVDRSNLGNAETDGMSKDLNFKGEEFSLLILLFYVPNGLCDLPLNILLKRFSGRIMLPSLMVGWGSMALLQAACKNFAGMLAIRLLLGAFEAGFFAGAVFYLTLFYQRGELGFRIAIFFGSALLASAFSGLISFGVFQIKVSHIQGWMWLFIIEEGISGTMTVFLGILAFWWLPADPQSAWFLTEEEKHVARQRALRDGSGVIGEEFNLKDCFKSWNSWRFAVWCVISLTYPVAFSTTSNFLPLIIRRLGYNTVITNLLTVPPNVAGFLVLLAATWSSDRNRERTLHIVGSLSTSLVGLLILAIIDAEAHIGVAYFACFMLCAGAYIPSCLVHSWHNNNNLSENSRAATTGLLVGLGNLGGILSAGTFRTTYAPRYAPTLMGTAACNVTCIIFTLGLGFWMRKQNRTKNEAQGVDLKAEDVATSEITHGEQDPRWRYFV